MYQNTLLLSIFFSFLFHLVAFSAGFFLDAPLPQQQSNENLVTIEIMSPPLEKLQIVEQTSANGAPNPNAKYLSKNNQSVLEERKASRIGKFKNNKAKNHPSSIKSYHNNHQSITKNGNGASVTPPALSPKEQQPYSTRDISQTDDYLKDIKRGTETLLNTKEFIYYSYYNRIKDSLQHHWKPRVRNKIIKIFQSGRHISSVQSRITSVRIILDSRGSLLNIFVINTSGIKELDNAAIEAFRLAAPFLNPPKGIIDPDGTIKIDWSFVLEA